VFATKNWTGNLSVTEGEHLEIVDDTIGILFWVVRNTNTHEEGAVLTDILMHCADHGDKCVIAKESFNYSLYATFSKGDQLILDTNKALENGWLYGKVKRSNTAKGSPAQDSYDPCGYAIKYQDGYIHPNWVQNRNAFIGFLLFRLFGLLLMTVDVFTDILNGLDYIGIFKLPLEDNEMVCEQLQNYQHPVWGSVAIGLSWMPGIPFFIYQIADTFRKHGSQYKIRQSLYNCLTATFTLLFWPLCSILM